MYNDLRTPDPTQSLSSLDGPQVIEAVTASQSQELTPAEDSITALEIQICIMRAERAAIVAKIPTLFAQLHAMRSKVADADTTDSAAPILLKLDNALSTARRYMQEDGVATHLQGSSQINRKSDEAGVPEARLGSEALEMSANNGDPVMLRDSGGAPSVANDGKGKGNDHTKL
ncbi:hypothetical protein FA95DRAFT_1564425 [Auriscalpium vulgare]|uniref:Uncharacterized protein n=1 Tax=Auriscalpium vulgare TaxID=40419 RepID=A0ACB8RFC7_9AGAM|nr:hypothetical protein FA95DRAFT_1564425 [Auriscalpium vulgare]